MKRYVVYWQGSQLGRAPIGGRGLELFPEYCILLFQTVHYPRRCVNTDSGTVYVFDRKTGQTSAYGNVRRP